MAVLLCCLLIAFISEVFHQRAEAVSEVDVNRVRLSYHVAYDNCGEITDETSSASKTAADEGCERAFKALDEIRQNNCRGWRHAACRLIPGDPYPQCTCLISYCDDFAIKNSIMTPFRSCAAVLWTRHPSTGAMLAPTKNFQQLRNPYDEALQEVELWRAFNYFDPSVWPEAGSSSHVYGSGGASTSRGVPIRDDPGSSSGIFTSGYENPSAAPYYPSYTPVAARGGPVIREPGSGVSRHDSTHQSTGSYCPLCHSHLPSEAIYWDHMLMVHPEIVLAKPARSAPANTAEEEKLMPYSCSVCHKGYYTQHGLSDHMRSHTTDDTKCWICNRTYSTRGNLKGHMEAAHPGVPMPEAAIRRRGANSGKQTSDRFVCRVCGKTYTHKSTLLDHEKGHQSLDTYCLDCDLYLASNNSYRAHMRRTHKVEIAESEAEYPEKCATCNKRFRSTIGLRDHEACHQGKTTCEVCGQKFPRKSTLSAHMKKEHSKYTPPTRKRKDHPK